MTDWITPTLQRREGIDNPVVIDPHPYPGIDGHTRLEARPAEQDRCGATCVEFGRRCVCALSQGHAGPHWKADPEFAEEIGVYRIWVVR